MKAPDAAPVAEQPPLPPALRWSDLSSSPPVMHETTVRTATKFVPPGHAGVTAPEDGVKIERTEVEPTGAYANIDVRAMNKSLAVLADLDHPAERAAEAARLEAHPEKGAPPLLFAMGRALFDGGRKEDGAFWYYAGMLRGRFDARRCADPSVGDTVTVMIRTYGPPISKWAYLDLDAMEKRIDRVVRWDEKTPREYDHRWINLNGIGAILSGLPGRDGVVGSMAPRKLSVPESEWPAIEKKTRDEFVATFRELLADMRKKR
jgi:hypothetical protein